MHFSFLICKKKIIGGPTLSHCLRIKWLKGSGLVYRSNYMMAIIMIIINTIIILAALSQKVYRLPSKTIDNLSPHPAPTLNEWGLNEKRKSLPPHPPQPEIPLLGVLPHFLLAVTPPGGDPHPTPDGSSSRPAGDLSRCFCFSDPGISSLLEAHASTVNIWKPAASQ